jgi:hypothetical protein
MKFIVNTAPIPISLVMSSKLDDIGYLDCMRRKNQRQKTFTVVSIAVNVFCVKRQFSGKNNPIDLENVYCYYNYSRNLSEN